MALPLRIAIIGAGMAGLTAARRLVAAGQGVQVFDKGRGVGGRMATRREGALQFDHGAQYFTARSAEFQAVVAEWCAAGVVSEWQGSILASAQPGLFAACEPLARYVGSPAMTAVAKHLARGIDVSCDLRITTFKRTEKGWRLTDDAGRSHGEFSAVLVTAPAPQAAELLAASPALANACRSVTMQPCWAVLVEHSSAPPAQFDGLFVNHGPLSWVARESSKPGRPPGATWVLHASRAWSAAHLDAPSEQVATELMAAWRTVLGLGEISATSVTAHLWRYSGPENPLAERCLVDADRQLFAAGDWCGGPRVEGAYLSGLAAAERMLEPRR